MEQRVIFGLALVRCIAARPAHCQYYSKSVPASHKEEKVTNLHFFLNDIVNGKNPSAVMVSRPNNLTDDKFPRPFDSVFAVDDLLRAGPETTSEIIGNARGLYLSSSHDPKDYEIVLYADFAFTTGEFKGSSFGVFSRNPVSQTVREVAVVGGRGKFRLARGYAKLKTTFFNVSNGDAIIEYNVTLFHY